MKKVLLAGLLAATVFTGCQFDVSAKLGNVTVTESAVIPTTNTIAITVVNRSTDTITDFYLSPSNTKDWGSNRISSNIASNGSRSVTVSDLSCTTLGSVDFRFVMQTETNDTLRFDQDINCDKTYEFVVDNF